MLRVMAHVMLQAAADPPMDVSASESVFAFKGTELVLFIGGAVVTLAVFAIAVWLYRMSSREHREQLERERRERGA